MNETKTQDPLSYYAMTDDKRSEIESRFTYHAPFGCQPAKYVALREEAKALALSICELSPECREQALAVTNLEQAIFWANAAIARRETNSIN